jgi:hypothetical protein
VGALLATTQASLGSPWMLVDALPCGTGQRLAVGVMTTTLQENEVSGVGEGPRAAGFVAFGL